MYLKPIKGKKMKLIDDIRGNKNRQKKLRNPKIMNVSGYSTVLSIYDGKNELGTIRAKDSTRAFKFLNAKEVYLGLEWDNKKTAQITVCT